MIAAANTMRPAKANSTAAGPLTANSSDVVSGPTMMPSPSGGARDGVRRAQLLGRRGELGQDRVVDGARERDRAGGEHRRRVDDERRRDEQRDAADERRARLHHVPDGERVVATPSIAHDRPERRDERGGHELRDHHHARRGRAALVVRLRA